ncbi:hypothetical protein SH1V18_48260 [Vallitalea longa]|uniref:Uncharacterized protein n=1 Tax=Vallitalea longa TaxID=2936439 RepID=A0A9W5YGQ2_9FIRM|nr:hypothetical protein [Vallitalea longa]GKX32346.1 hypothetical protein SH1V18_48260 [Vallitalea longa]
MYKCRKLQAVLILGVYTIFIVISIIGLNNIGGKKIDMSMLEYHLEEGKVMKMSKKGSLIKTYKLVIERNGDKDVYKVDEDEYLIVEKNDTIYFAYIGDYLYDIYLRKSTAEKFLTEKPDINLQEPNLLNKIFSLNNCKYYDGDKNECIYYGSEKRGF